jgi:L-lactate dehydrogenase (cytochrome)
MFYDYADSGAWTESTYRANSDDFQTIKLRQRVAVNMENRSTASTMVGQAVAMPVAIAPTGLTGMQHADGEILAANAARKFGIPFTLSTMSICSIEDVAQETGGHPFWFQLYVMKDRDFIERLIDRAKAARCSALVLTLDLQILGQRHKDLKNGLSAPPKPTLATILNLATKVRWGLGMLGTQRRGFGNIVGHVKGVDDMGNLGAWTAEQFDPALNWADVEWVKKRWGGKLILKGIQDVEDARLAVLSGADALIVSNHGGRQLDGAESSIRALPAIVDAVGQQIEVHMDGGIRSGQDVLKARALGARGTYIGRAFLYGLGALGEAGVTKALEIIHKELDLTMAFWTLDADWIGWIQTNIQRGCDQDGIFKTLLDEGYAWQDIQICMGYTPNVPLDQLVNPLGREPKPTAELTQCLPEVVVDRDQFWIPNGRRMDCPTLEIYTLADVLSAAECLALQAQFDPVVVGPAEGHAPTVQASLDALQLRLCKLVGIHPAYAETLTCQHFEVGEGVPVHQLGTKSKSASSGKGLDRKPRLRMSLSMPGCWPAPGRRFRPGLFARHIHDAEHQARAQPLPLEVVGHHQRELAAGLVGVGDVA